MNPEDEAILGVLQGREENCGEKDGGKTGSIPTAGRLRRVFCIFLLTSGLRGAILAEIKGSRLWLRVDLLKVFTH